MAWCAFTPCFTTGSSPYYGIAVTVKTMFTILHTTVLPPGFYVVSQDYRTKLLLNSLILSLSFLLSVLILVSVLLFKKKSRLDLAAWHIDTSYD